MKRAPTAEGEDAHDPPVATSFPHLLVRELNAFLAVTLLLLVVSMLANAPLEGVANPWRTPNPAKAPWYFLGLQELLHYFPPFISGVLLPLLCVVALAVIPYFKVNQRRRPCWTGNRTRKLVWLGVSVAVVSEVLAWAGAHPVWPMLIPTWTVAALASLGAPKHALGQPGRWLRARSLPFWVFCWFLITACALTVVGVYFRGPGWSFTLPWRDGVF